MFIYHDPFILVLIEAVLIDFSPTVKAATLIFISGRGSTISSAKKGNQVLFIFTDKHCGPRPDCSCRSSLIWVHYVCLYAYVK